MAATTEQADKQKIAEAFRAEATGDSLPYDPSHNIAPTSTQPVLRQERETFRRELVPMRWGLVGFGSKGIDPKRSTFNARAQGLKRSSLWNRPLHRQRCIVPMDGYYHTGTRQRRFLNGSRHVGALVIVSERALMVDSPLMSFRSFVKNGTRPQRARISSRSPVSRMIGWCVVGATL